MSTSNRDFARALIVLGLSGGAALGHQLLWTRRMADLIGASGDANARVFGCFFLGLALGAAAVSRFGPRLKRAWRTAGWIELGVAILALPALWLNHWSTPFWEALGPEELLDWEGTGLKWLLSFLLILPPAILVGMTLPVVRSAVCGKGDSRKTVWLYAVYTAGGSLGIAAVLGAALPFLGAAGSMLLMMGLNVLAAGLCFARGAVGFETACSTPEQPACTSARRELLMATPLVVSFLSGAGVLTLEVLGLQLLNLKAPLAFYTPGVMLFCVVLLLAGSAAGVAIFERFFNEPTHALMPGTALAGVAIAVAPLLFLSVTAGRSGIGTHSGHLGTALLHLGWATCASIGPGVFFAGLIFPLLVSGPAQDIPSSSANFGQLLAVNGIGGLLGAEAAHRVLLPWFGPHLALGVLGAGYGLLSLALTILQQRKLTRGLAFPVGSLVITCVLLVSALAGAPVFLRGATFNVVQIRCGREGTLAIVERPDIGRAMFLDNHYMLGGTAALPEMQRQAHVPLLLHPAPKRVCFIGLGTGITAAGALKHSAVESIEAIELCPLVAESAQTHFLEYNNGVCRHPKVRVSVEDACTYISAARGRYDVIIGDLFTPWRPGEARLCSQEQFTAAKDALKPGGVFCQWLPMTQLTMEQFHTVARTFRKAFGEAHLFRNDFHGRSLPLAMVGFKNAALDWNAVNRRCELEKAQGLLRDPLGRHVEGLALLYLGRYHDNASTEETLNTLDNLQVEARAGRHLLAGDPADYFAGAGELWSGFISNQVISLERDRGLPEGLRGLPRLGLAIARWQSAQEANAPNAQALKQDVLLALPGSVLRDDDADWSLWCRGELKSDL